MEKKKICFVVLLLALLLSACAKPVENPPQQDDWTALFGGQPASTEGAGMTPPVSADGEKTPTKAPASGGYVIPTMEELKARMEYPAQIPPREFVPAEDQTELVLWLPEFSADLIDKHIVVELNHILQSRGYSFYLTVKQEYPREKLDSPCIWQEVLDSGEQVDLIYMDDLRDGEQAVPIYGEQAIVRAIQGGYLLPFSAYPETEAKERLLAAYPESYWKLCRFSGENYGVSRYMCDVWADSYLLWNLDAAAKAGLSAPEELDVMHLDEMLEQAAAAGVPGAYLSEFESFETGFEKLSRGLYDLYVKYRQDGSFCLTNPYRDEEILAIWDTMHRYWENGWLSDYEREGPLIICHSMSSREGESGTGLDLQENRFRYLTEDGNVNEINVKIYPCKMEVLEEGDIKGLFGITSSTKHPEEAVELFCLLQTDEEIVQLLRYGLENVHYRIGEDGIEDVVSSYVQMHYESRSIPLPYGGLWVIPVTENDEPPADEEPFGWSVGNRTTTVPGKYIIGNCLLPVELDEMFGTKDSTETAYRTWEGIRMLPYFGALSEEQIGVLKKMRDILYTMVNNTQIKKGDWRRSDYKQTLEEVQTALEEIGYDRLVEEINQKMGLK